MAAWTLLNELKLGDSGGCEGEVSGPEGAYFDFSDSSHWANEEARSVERLIADANAAEVYRKALEPFAREWASLQVEGLGSAGTWIERQVEDEAHHVALRDACRLMGIMPAYAEDNDG